MIDQTRAWLDLWEEGMGGTDLYRVALDSGQFPTVSARRLHDAIAVGFAPRYLRDDGQTAKLLKALKESNYAQRV